MSRREAPVGAGRSVAAVGAGGNIGSHLTTHLARMPGVADVTLIDRDVYEEKNLRSQDIRAADVGRKKAVVQAARLRRMAPGLRVRAIVADVEDLPLGVLRADLILGGLDSLDARCHVGRAAMLLGVPWIDAGVATDRCEARIDVYVPGPDQPCLECSWDDRHYDALSTAHPCLAGRDPAPSTNGISALGALAASYQALEARRILTEGPVTAAAGRRIVVDAANHRLTVTALTRNPACRCAHETPVIERLDVAPDRTTVGDLLGRSVDGAAPYIRAVGDVFVRRLVCPASDCGGARRLFRLSARLTAASRSCPRCASIMVARGLDLDDVLGAPECSPAMLRRSLRSLGFRGGDVLVVGGGGDERHYVLGE